eukprot:1037137-Prorocentrum_minimum.AAC.3
MRNVPAADSSPHVSTHTPWKNSRTCARHREAESHTPHTHRSSWAPFPLDMNAVFVPRVCAVVCVPKTLKLAGDPQPVNVATGDIHDSVNVVTLEKSEARKASEGFRCPYTSIQGGRTSVAVIRFHSLDEHFLFARGPLG